MPLNPSLINYFSSTEQTAKVLDAIPLEAPTYDEKRLQDLTYQCPDLVPYGGTKKAAAGRDAILAFCDSVAHLIPGASAEMVGLNRLIRSFDIAVDLLVVSDEKFQYWRDTPGNVYYEAATGGQVLYQAA